ncbi:MAG TPA: Holliday junction branch migration protein RuvA [Candidatus Paceibacterota bacterium]|jgi:Holliday junction DNA helicase RuvA
MIRQIRGQVLESELAGAVIDVNGWGVFVRLAAGTTLTVGTEATVVTYLAIKQDGAELYGFTTKEDLRFFELLLTVSGVGPKTALSILSRASRESLEGAIAKRDISYLTRVVGLGKKAAEKIAVELSEKIEVGEREHEGDDAEVFDTLVALGYTEREARKALSTVPLHITGRDARLKSALGGQG